MSQNLTRSNAAGPQPVVLMLLLRGTGPHPEVLLGRKLTGFGAGNVVAPGGKIEPGEPAGDAAVRELAEETGIITRVADIEHRATVLFRFPTRPAADMHCQIFWSRTFEGTPQASSELEPAWYRVDRLPVEHMWQDAEHWLPRIISGERFTATVVMAPDRLGVEQVSFTPW